MLTCSETEFGAIAPMLRKETQLFSAWYENVPAKKFQLDMVSSRIVWLAAVPLCNQMDFRQEKNVKKYTE